MGDLVETPLLGKTIIITRAQEQQAEAKNSLQALGARVLDLPALKIGPPDNFEKLDNALEEIKKFDWIIFSSANGIRFVEERLKIKSLSLSMFSDSLKIAVVGRKTAKKLNQIGVEANFIPPEFVADSLIQNFPENKNGLKILLPRVQTGGRPILADSFEKSGSIVEEVPAYESRCPESIPSETLTALIQNKVDLIAFTSGKTVYHTYKLIYQYFGDEWEEKFINIAIISIGPQTSLSCLKYFRKFDREAHPHDIEGLICACINKIKDV